MIKTCALQTSLLVMLALSGCGSSQARQPASPVAPTSAEPTTTTKEAMNPTAAADIEAALRALANGSAANADFTFVYDDMHGLYGGETITVNGDGTLQAVWELRPEDARSEYAGTVSPASLRDLATLLVAQRAWRHETPERTYLPDTVFAHVRLRFGAASSDAWEVHGQLRLGQIKRAMEALVPALATQP
jgi:hypothetical protein